ncbi:hypothetical protein WOLCODRAFT_61508 [Wolfiporia cocos MD-104 SS10]|uniref:Uncharacterized protein n=1 Tax=Wolfiporia cocos (strain MD-104) TaxID=742152 RepID=A0A2H3IT81_WOLCO|nr:hypothetical protein WOLCODRAFT_61508 [Wolfiporia cocos MD-104 SS10]
MIYPSRGVYYNLPFWVTIYNHVSLSYFAAISRLSTDDLAAQRSNIHLSLAERELRANLSSAQFQQDLIRRWLETLQAEPATTNESVPAMERRKAALIVKAKEYQDELNAQMPNDPPITVSQLAETQKQLKAKERTLAEKRAKVKAFQGLPPNVDVARHKLKNAREEQMKLIQLRDRLLDRMVSGVS